MLKEVFKERITELYQEQGTSATVMAKKAGITPAAMNYYLSGKRLPHLPELYKICTTFNCSADWLLGLPGAVRSPDTDIKTICNKTGLSELAVHVLTGHYHGLIGVDEISEFITDLRFANVTLPLASYKKIQPAWTEKAFPTPAPDGNMILPPIETARLYLNEAVNAFRKILDEDFENDWKEVIEAERDFLTNPDPDEYD